MMHMRICTQMLRCYGVSLGHRQVDCVLSCVKSSLDLLAMHVTFASFLINNIVLGGSFAAVPDVSSYVAMIRSRCRSACGMLW
jgi:hypothetical protein